MEKEDEHLQEQRDSNNFAEGSITSSIAALPNEILQDIFFWTIGRIHGGIYDKATIQNPLAFNDAHPNVTRRRIAGVCRLWKLILDGTPSLWTTVILDKPWKNTLATLTNILSSSAVSTLELYISYTAFKSAIDASITIGTLRPHFSRISLLVANFSAQRTNTDMVILFGMFPWGIPADKFERLRGLVFGVDGIRWDLPVEKMARIHIPTLSKLTLATPASLIFHLLSSASLEGLKEIRISSPMDNNSLGILRNCRNLVHLDITLDLVPVDGDALSTTPAMFEHLVNFRISVFSVNLSRLIAFFKWTKLPNLRQLSLHYLDGRTTFVETFCKCTALLASIDAPTIVYLTLSRMLLQVEDASDMFTRFPNLSRLEFLRCKLAPVFFRNLESWGDKHEKDMKTPEEIGLISLSLCVFDIRDLKVFVEKQAARGVGIFHFVMLARSLSPEDSSLLDWMVEFYPGVIELKRVKG